MTNGKGGNRRQGEDRKKVENNYPIFSIECPHCDMRVKYNSETVLECTHCDNTIYIHRFKDNSIICQKNQDTKAGPV